MINLSKPGYYYQHIDGTVHYKPFIVVEMGGGPIDYFNSPFVLKYWKVNDLGLTEE